MSCIRTRLLVSLLRLAQLSNLSLCTTLLGRGEVYLALGWNGDAAVLQQAGVPVEYALPIEGVEIWEDGFAIPANAQQPSLAHQFIDFMLHAMQQPRRCYHLQ